MKETYLGRISARLEVLKRRLGEDGFAAAILMHSRDVLYYTGTAQPCNLMVTPDHVTLFARRSFDLVKEDAFIDDVVEAPSFGPIKSRLNEIGLRGGLIGVEEDVIPARLYQSLHEAFSDFRFANVSPIVLEQRMIKDEMEMNLIRKSCDLFKEGHETILRTLRPGITEVELAAAVESAMRRRGHEGVIFFRRWDAQLQGGGILASGENLWKISGQAMTVTGVGLSRALPWGPSARTIMEGDLVVFDSGANYQGYHADFARTYVAGKAMEEQRKIYRSLLRVQESVLGRVRPGMGSDQLYGVARAVAQAEGYQDYFQGYGGQRGEYVGHGVGLELDEPPVLGPREDTPLREKMVLTVEPKFIIPGFGAVMVEDTVLVKKDGYERLSKVEPDLFEVT